GRPRRDRAAQGRGPDLEEGAVRGRRGVGRARALTRPQRFPASAGDEGGFAAGAAAGGDAAAPAPAAAAPAPVAGVAPAGGAAAPAALALAARALQPSLSWSRCSSRHLASIPFACGTDAQNFAMSSLHSPPPVVRSSVMRARQLTDSSPSCSQRQR